MPLIMEDAWINGQATTHDAAELEDCAIGVDASYFLSYLLERTPAHEPLLPALSGLTGIHAHINESLDELDKLRILPLFVFDGQSLTGQDDISLKRSQAANQKTNEAWKLYSQSEAEQAVASFGANPDAYQIQNLYPLFQQILKQRGLHFLVAPYNACAQLAYFEMIDSDQIAGVMGPQELLVYPIKDSVIRSFDFENKKVSAISKQKIMRSLAVNDSMFVDAMLMNGTSFLSPFPPLLDTTMYQAFSVMDAVNILRTADKAVTNACASFNDVLQAQDPNWLEKYRKARLAVHHFIAIAENGEIRVNENDRLTQDNHEYLGLQMPAELFHYLNTGLIGPRILNSITHSRMLVQPPLEGGASDEYKKLITSQLVPIKEQTLGLVIPRVHRGIGHKAVTMKVWFDPKFSHTLNHSGLSPPPSQKVGSWDITQNDIDSLFPEDFKPGVLSFEVLSLLHDDFAAKTLAKEKIIRGIDSTGTVISVAIWRFLHLRGYVNDAHKLTPWGSSLASALLTLDALAVPGIQEAALLAYELIRFGLLHGRKSDTQAGLPRKGSEEDKNSLTLISKSASLLKLRHQAFGYTGPLNKSLLAFRSLSTAVREADRDLIEAIVASMFMFGQSKREREDQVEISQKLPFSQEPDIGLGIAIQTFFDEDELSDDQETRQKRLAHFPGIFVPYAEALEADFRICVSFVKAINEGIQHLGPDNLAAEDKEAWATAQAYLEARPF